MTSTTNKIDKNWNREDGLGSRSITELFVPLPSVTTVKKSLFRALHY